MSASVLSIYMLGYRLPGTALDATKCERGCAHPELPTNFCPECGKHVWLSTVDQLLYDEDQIGDNLTVRVRGYDFRNNRGRDERMAYVGRELPPISGQYHTSFMDEMQLTVFVQAMPYIKRQLDDELRARGISFENCKFGLHLVAALC